MEDDPPPYVVRFVILRLECPALSNGAMYCVDWRRGTYRGSTPLFVCDSGVVDFSRMPEAHAIIHFKPNASSGGKGTSRFQHKYITLSIEEATRGGKGRTQVGLLEFDVANCLPPSERKARVTKHADFRMAGLGASIEVQVTLYPEGDSPPPPLASDTAAAASVLAASSAQRGGAAATSLARDAPPTAPSAVTTGAPIAAPAVVASTVGRSKKLTRDEAMALLITVEGLIEQRGSAAGATYGGEDDFAISQQILDLEQEVNLLKDKLNAKHMIQGASLRVAVAESGPYVKAHFAAETRAPCAAFKADVTTYLQSIYDASQRSGKASAPSLLTAVLEQQLLAVQVELKQLAAEQETLAQLQLRRDVTADAMRNLEKVHEKEQQLARLQQQLASNQQQAASASLDGGPTGTWESAKRAVLEDIQASRRKVETLQLVLDDYRRTYALRIEDWASRKFAPMREQDRLQKELRSQAEMDKRQRQQRIAQQQVLDLFGELQSPPTAANPVSSNGQDTSGKHNSDALQNPFQEPAEDTKPADLFARAQVPSATDFAPSVTNRANGSSDNSGGVTAATITSAQHQQSSLEAQYQFGHPPAASTGTAPSRTTELRRVDPFSDLRENRFDDSEPGKKEGDVGVSSSTNPSAGGVGDGRNGKAGSSANPNNSHFSFDPDVESGLASGSGSATSRPQPADPTATRNELRRTYVFGVEEDSAPAVGGSGAAASFVPSAFSAYTFGPSASALGGNATSDGSTYATLRPSTATTTAVGSYSFAPATADFGSMQNTNSTTANGGDASVRTFGSGASATGGTFAATAVEVSNDSLFGSPSAATIATLVRTSNQPPITGTAAQYSFEDSQSGSQQPAANMFASFGESHEF